MVRAVPGAEATVTITQLDSTGTAITTPVTSDPLPMQSTSPDQITTISSSAPDGRHRNFTIVVPYYNGESIEMFVLRRTQNSANPYYYNVSCVDRTVDCSDHYLPTCWTTPPPCATNEAGASFSFVVGSELFPTDPHYIFPMQSYEWAIIATNKKNRGCYLSGTNGADCDTQSYGSWSTVQTFTQPEASPNQPSTYSITPTGSTTLELSWAPAVDNGAAVQMYETVCRDTSDYLVEAWKQPDAIQYAPPSSDPITSTVHSLTPGTNYTCKVAANNSAGGFLPVLFSTFTPARTTFPASPDDVSSANTSCVVGYDPIVDGANGRFGAPSTQAPSMELTVRWNAPRPNNGADNGKGPPQYRFSGPLADANFTVPSGTPALQQSNVAPHPAGSYYGYDQTYTFTVQPWSPGYFGAGFTSFSCTTGGFRPDAPVVTLDPTTMVFDRSILIRWTAPNNNGAPITQYIYQICLGNCTASQFDGASASFNARAHMCGDGSVGWGSKKCTANEGGVWPAGTDFKLTGVAGSQTDTTATLLPSTEYSLVIRARNDLDASVIPGTEVRRWGIGWASPIFTFTTKSVPATPTSTTIEQRRISLEWAAYTDAVGYNVTMSGNLFSGNGVAAASVTLSSATNSITFTGLVPFQCYTFSVRAELAQFTGPSDEASFCTSPDAPQPASLTLVSSGTTSAMVSFPKPPANGFPIDGFVAVLRTTSIYGEDANTTIALTASALSFDAGQGVYSYTVGGMTPAVSYTIQMAATNQKGTAPLSNPVTATTCASEPATPAAPTFHNHSTSSIGVVWDPPTASAPNNPTYDFGAPVTDYRVTYQRVDNPSLTFGPFEGTGYLPGSGRLFFQATDGIEPGRYYQFRVSAYNGVLRVLGSTDCSAAGLTSDGWSDLGGQPFSAAMTTAMMFDPPGARA